VQNISASNQRTFVLHAQTDQGLFLTRDGGLSWRAAPEGEQVVFPKSEFKQWLKVSTHLWCRVSDERDLMVSSDAGESSTRSMKGWRIPKAVAAFVTRRGIVASGPGGCYRSTDGATWTELKVWKESETGAADFLHAYWMGRYYGFVKAGE